MLYVNFNLLSGKETSFLQQMVKLHETTDGETGSVCGNSRTNANRHCVEQLERARENEEITKVGLGALLCRSVV